ncbi:hypothetical protein [Streptomyces nitrosporeus]|uniref:hypothetical protein n=1 Tax=Streptomyces nitrosporeus TaxID=28894 RepID=UPI0033251611
MLASTVLVTLLTGCSEKVEAAPELPARICWDAFASKEVSPLLPPGKEAEFDTYSMRPFFPVEESEYATCVLQIDGAASFTADARRVDFEELVDWTTWEKLGPAPIDAGKKGIVWHNGAASYIVCEPSKGPDTPGKYIDMSLYVHDLPKKGDRAEESRRIFTDLMKQFVAFTQKELKCG